MDIIKAKITPLIGEEDFSRNKDIFVFFVLIIPIEITKTMF